MKLTQPLYLDLCKALNRMDLASVPEAARAVESALSSIPDPYVLTSDLVNAHRHLKELEAKLAEAESKLAKLREWAEAQYETQVTVRDDCGNEILAILDGK